MSVPVAMLRRSAPGRVLGVCLTLALLSLWPPAARAADGHAAEAATKPAKAVQPPPLHATVKGEAPAVAAAPAARGGGADPMDQLRERLAQKLGATKAPEAPSPYVVRVTTKATGDAHDDGHGAAAPAPAPRKVARPAAPRPPVKAAAKTDGHGPAAAGGHAAHWSYGADGGPEQWGRLRPEFSLCGSGQRQSPIDIRGGIKVDLEPIAIDYQSSAFRVVDNGHTVQVNVAGGNAIEVQGRRYDLLQFHFHRPSEERIDGRQFDMVAHLVHKDPEGRLAVIAVLLDRGSAHPLVQTVWNNLPLEKSSEVAAAGAIDLNQLLPADRRYYTYMGSLTTPPCSEGVLWLVMQQPVTISKEQIAIFSRLYPMNARPVQQASGRLIKQNP